MISWPAVFVGWLVDFSLRIAIQVATAWLGLAQFYTAPDLARPDHVSILVLLLAATAAGGFVAARLAEGNFLLTGLLVGATGILAAAISNPGLVPVPPALVLAQALSLGSGALGGLLARRMKAEG